jgi:hypothetical protein
MVNRYRGQYNAVSKSVMNTWALLALAISSKGFAIVLNALYVLAVSIGCNSPTQSMARRIGLALPCQFW